MGCCESQNSLLVNSKSTDAVKVKKLYPSHFPAKVTRIIDGDTVEIIHLFLGRLVISSLRIYGVDTEELKSGSIKALQAKEFAKKHLLDKVFDVTLRDEKTEKYGRLLGDIYVPEKRTTFSKMLLQEKLAKEYFGGKK